MPGENGVDLGRRLGQLEQPPPGYAFDKEAAWQRIVQGSPALQRRRRATVWWAAAALLLILPLSLLWWRKTPARKEVTITHPQPVTQPQAKTPATVAAPQKQSRSLQTKSKTPVVAEATKENKRAVLPQAIAVDTKPQLQLTVQPSTPVAVVNTAAAATRPRFRIVHVNELDLSQPAPVKPAEAQAFQAWQRRKPVVETAVPEDETPLLVRKKRTLFSSLAPTVQQ